MSDHLSAAQEHCRALHAALDGFRRTGLEQVTAWGEHLASVLPVGGRLLAAGNGGSAAQAQHLTAELVGRYRDERPAYSAIALHAETSSVTAIGNDYGFDELYARQVAAHGRPGDVLMLLSTSGRSPNLLAAADTGHAAGLLVWAMTGPSPNPLAARADDALSVDAPATATVQETHLVALHLVCAAFDAASGVRAVSGRVATGRAEADPAAAGRATAGRATALVTADGTHSPTGSRPDGRNPADGAAARQRPPADTG